MNKILRPEADCLLEVSWEVCNKVGGIYTVIVSKLAPILERYKEYILIGPYFANKVPGQFKEAMAPDELKRIFDELKKEGIICHYGNWTVEGEPTVILVDCAGFRHSINEIKGLLWETFQIDSLRASGDYDEPLVWSYAVGKIIEHIGNTFPQKKIVAQFHEWLAGAGLLHLKKSQSNVATVFTTHATVLGRSLVGTGVDLLCTGDDEKCTLETLNLDDEAYKLHCESKHQLERASAQNADIFTTVSKITEIEATHVLQRKPDILLPNGIDKNKFPTLEDRAIKHTLYKNKIKDFLLYYFFPYYSFDINNTLFFFTASRYEFRAKGLDILIAALGKVNKKLKESKSNLTVVTFFWVPGNIRGVRTELVENKSFYEDVKDEIEDELGTIKNNLVFDLISKKSITAQTLFNKDFLLGLKNKVNRLSKKGLPGMCTHDLVDENDEIMSAFAKNDLNNTKEDRVKVIFYPTYLNGADGLLDLEYYQAILGTHLGIFPSFYEPWGYTPLEAGALGVPAITTDLAGFGRYIQEKLKKTNQGIYVLNRTDRSDKQATMDMAKAIMKFANLSRSDRMANKVVAKKLASLADWQILIDHYVEAHNKATSKRS